MKTLGRGRGPSGRIKKRRAYKPGSVPLSGPSPSISSDGCPPDRRAANPWIERAALHCSALLAARLAMPPPSPATRWALTPPFHPCRRPFGPSACSSRFRASRSLQASTSGGIFSVALSVPRRRPLAGGERPLRRPGAYPALCSREPGLSSASTRGCRRRRRGPPSTKIGRASCQADLRCLYQKLIRWRWSDRARDSAAPDHYSSASSMEDSFSPSSESSS